MKDYRIKITLSDITYMKDGYCIAGWNDATRSMKRLLPNGRHWTDEDIKKLKRYSDILIEVVSGNEPGQYPHKMENIVISDNVQTLKEYNDPKILALALQHSASPSIKKIFDGKLKDNSYVNADTKCASLGAIILPTKNIELYQSDDKKLRIRIDDSDKEKYDLRITCKYLRDVLDDETAFQKLNDEIRNSRSNAHIRVGLARPFVYRDNNCYLMCNGVFLY